MLELRGQFTYFADELTVRRYKSDPVKNRFRTKNDAGSIKLGGKKQPNSVIAGLTRNPFQIGAEICPGFARVRLRAAAIMDSGRAADGVRRNDGFWPNYEVQRAKTSVSF
jgi:hypothetical protein